MRRVLRRLPAVALAVFLVWASSPLWRLTSVLPDTVARFIPPGQAVAVLGILGALICLVLVCWQGWRRRAPWPPVVGVVAVLAVVVPVTVVTTQAGSAGESATGRHDDDGSGTLRVMALNTYFGGADDASVVAETRRLDPDILVLAETDDSEVAAVEEGTGMVATAPADDRGGASGTVVFVRDGVVPSGVDADLGLTGHQTPSVTLAEPAPVEMVGVHTLPPGYSDLFPGWARDLDRLGDAFNGGAGDDGPLILAGDFNATVAHPEFRDLLDDADLQRCDGGSALRGAATWPDRFPLVRIDHILVRGGTCGDTGTVRVDGTDHRGVWADITL